MVMHDGTRVPIEEILDITGEMFQVGDEFFELKWGKRILGVSYT